MRCYSLWAALSVLFVIGTFTVRAEPTTTTSPATTQAAIQRVHALVSGKVQGVGFRAFVQEHAQKLKLTGWTANLKDGRVELVAEGQAKAVTDLLEKVKQGPAGGHVDKVETTDEKPTGEFDKFLIK